MNYPVLPPAACLLCGVALPERRHTRQAYCTPRHAQTAARRRLVSTADKHTRTLTLTVKGHTAALEILRRRDVRAVS